MDLSAVGGYVFEEMCKWNLEGKQKGKARQQATNDGFERAHKQKAER